MSHLVLHLGTLTLPPNKPDRAQNNDSREMGMVCMSHVFIQPS